MQLGATRAEQLSAGRSLSRDPILETVVRAMQGLSIGQNRFEQIQFSQAS